MAILRSVAKTDTFEAQRKTINLIGQDLFDVSSGTASQNFNKVLLADGSTTAPSISFIDEENLGFYRSSIGSLSVSATDSDVFKFSTSGNTSFSNLTFTKYFIQNSDVTVTNGGSGYSTGTFTDVFLTGGTGTGAIADLIVSVFSGTVNNFGSGYTEGDYVSKEIRRISGSGSGVKASFSVSASGSITNFTINDYGTGITSGSTLGLYGVTSNVSTTLDTGSNLITVADTSAIVAASTVTVTSGVGTLPGGTTVSSIVSATEIELSQNPSGDGAATLSFTPDYGAGSNFLYTVGLLNTVTSVDITNGGSGYSQGDVLSVISSDLSIPTEYEVTVETLQSLTFVETIPSGTFVIGGTLELSSDGQPYQIYEINISGGNITSIVIANGSFQPSDLVIETGIVSPTYTVDTATLVDRFVIDGTITPDLTLYVGSQYVFTYPSGHPFAFSTTANGTHNGGTEYTNQIQRDEENNTLTVSPSVGYPSTLYYFCTSHSGMGGTAEVTIDTNNPNPPGSGFELVASTVSVEDTINCDIVSGEIDSISSSTTNLSATNGSITSLTSTTGSITTLNSTTINGQGSGLTINSSGTTNITINPAQNLNVGTLLSIAKSTGNLTTSGVIKSTGSFNSNDALTIADNTISSLSAVNLILSPASGKNVSIAANTSLIIPVGSTGQRPTGIDVESGAIRFNTETQQYEGYNGIAAAWSSLGGVRDVDGNTYILAEEFTGANDNTIWFYNGGNNSLKVSQSEINLVGARTISSSNYTGLLSWDEYTYYSLGSFVYYEDNVYEVTASGLTDNIAPIHETGSLSANGGDPPIVGAIADYTISTPSGNNSAGTYQYEDTAYGGAIFSITFSDGLVVSSSIISQGTGGYTTTGGSSDNIITILGSNIGGVDGSDDLLITVTELAGSVELTWNRTVAGEVIFNGISEVSVNDAPLKIKNSINSAELSLLGNSINCNQTLTIGVASGSNIVCDAITSLAIPSGTEQERGTPTVGSIRYNTESNQYEGYNSSSTTWSSLGGVRDVDGNTYIIPELSAGSNENILYFYNDDDNTLQLKKTELSFETVDTITSSSDTLSINVGSVSFNNNDFSIDNTDISTTLLSSSKTNLDLGMSVGLSIDTVLRFTSSGEIYLNKTFGSGTFTGVKFLDGALKTFELDDFQIKTFEISLEKGVTDSGAAAIYDPTLISSSKISVSGVDIVTNDVQTEEFNVIVKNGDIYNVEYGSNKTSTIYSTSFDLSPSGILRVNITLDSSVSPGNGVKVTIVSTNVKK